MRKLILLIAATLSVFCCIVFARQPDTILKSGGAHPGSTGAPGEETCAKSGCHVNASISPGNGVNTFQFGNNATTYTPGQTYPIKITAQRAGITRFGFEVVALDKNNKSIGTFKITESTRTQIINATIDAAKRFYVTHKLAGTPAVSDGVGEWSFSWTAPTNYSDSVRFYYTTNATNNDNTNQGDALFLSSVAFAAGSPNSVEENGNNEPVVSLYPNPASSFIVLKNVESNSSIEVFGVNGESLMQQKIGNGDNQISIGKLSAGKYYIQVTKLNGKKEILSFVK